MKKNNIVYLLAVIFLVLAGIIFIPTMFVHRFKSDKADQSIGYIGSASCRQCHEDFYKLWAGSHHGLAMQEYTDKFAAENLTVQKDPVNVAPYQYKAEIEVGQGWVLQTGEGKPKKYPIVHAMGSKNIYYFLTPLEKGKLQVLPVAYDINREEWFNTAQSAMRHFPDATDAALNWTDSFYTFNTSCHGCHVSQLTNNYDSSSDSYHTTWAEPGINCETCHGPAGEHAETCLKAGEGEIPEDLKIISTSHFSPDQINSMCGSCHGKAGAISSSFMPGETFFDHFDLTTLENSDYYPDGRDLGENYTMTSWMMSRCVKAGELDCMHCHTSSGRYRFVEAKTANNACMPCHEEILTNLTDHTHHETDSEGSKCIGCHLPMTEFARMRRSDHSMRPPAPAATIAFKSPNACNICHDDKDAAWSDEYVRRWYEDDYQKPILEQGYLVDAGRKGDWKQLDKILEYISGEGRDEITAVSLIKLLRAANLEKISKPLINTAIKDQSPLIRSAAADILGSLLTEQSVSALLISTRDKSRLVRIRSAANLAGLPDEMVPTDYKQDLQDAMDEYLESLNARQDSYTSQYNLGNYHMAKGKYYDAIASFDKSKKLRPDFLASYVNAAFAYNAIGENFNAQASFEKALGIDPNNAAVHINLAMLMGEMNKPSQAEQHFRKALQIEPNSGVAAYNLGVILGSKEKIPEAVRFCGKAYKLQPDDGKYAYTYAFYLDRVGNTEEAIKVLEAIVAKKIPYPDAYGFLATIYQKQGQIDKVRQLLQAAVDNKGFSQAVRSQFEQMLNQLP